MQARRDTSARDRLLAAIERGEVRWCWPVRYELTIDARSSDGIAAVERTLDALCEVPLDRSVQRAVPSLKRELAAGSARGAHRYPLADLTVAAQHAGVDILHFDQRLERLGDRLGVDSFRIGRPQ